MTEEYNNITLVSYNPSNPRNKLLYQEIAKALGSDLLELVPPLLSKQSLEEICGGLPPRVWVHDGTTYKVDPVLENVRSLVDVPDSYIDPSIHIGQPCHPVMIYKGEDMKIRDVTRLFNVVGVNWIFGFDNSLFTPEYIKRIVEKIEELAKKPS